MSHDELRAVSPYREYHQGDIQVEKKEMGQDGVLTHSIVNGTLTRRLVLLRQLIVFCYLRNDPVRKTTWKQ